MNAVELFDPRLLDEMLDTGHVRCQKHPELPLRILNYAPQAAYESVWNDVTLACRGLILDSAGEVAARPFRKFFNHGEPNAPALDLDARAVVTDKMDGSLGILYPTPNGHAVATRGSFTSDQARHASVVYGSEYQGAWEPAPGRTYLYEIIFPSNRIVIDYGAADDLVLLAVLDNETGLPVEDARWPGPAVETFPYASLLAALAAPPRENAEGFVVYLPEQDARVKIKQDDYVALHRILTGTNARNVWEVVAVRACAPHVSDPKHWGSYLRIDPARAEEILALGDEWLASVPDEFYVWVDEVTAECSGKASAQIANGRALVEVARRLQGRERYEWVVAQEHPAQKEILRLADGREEEWARLCMRSWLAAAPAPTAPWARTDEDAA